MIGIICDAHDPIGDLRVEGPGSSTDDVKWFDLADASALRSVELLDFALDLG